MLVKLLKICSQTSLVKLGLAVSQIWLIAVKFGLVQLGQLWSNSAQNRLPAARSNYSQLGDSFKWAHIVFELRLSIRFYRRTEYANCHLQKIEMEEHVVF